VSLGRLLKKTGPLVAPSANPQGLPPASNVKEAKIYFGERVDFYVPGGSPAAKSSKIIKITEKGVEILRG
jgi:L-threonylcarbamoyladenylate synthase